MDITINDGIGNNGKGWYSISFEDQEVEPGNETGQAWDMEQFLLNGTELTMIGGYNFTDPLGYKGYKPGDIFIDIGGNGYDYVLNISQAEPYYNVYSLGNTYSVFYAQNNNSNPWKYKDGGQLIAENISASYNSFSDKQGLHYQFSTDLSWLLPKIQHNDSIVFHYTMECGNDNLMGHHVYHSEIPEMPTIGLIPVVMMLCLVRRLK